MSYVLKLFKFILYGIFQDQSIYFIIIKNIELHNLTTYFGAVSPVDFLIIVHMKKLKVEILWTVKYALLRCPHML